MSPSGHDANFKYFGLLLLTLQQASMPLMARYSRAREDSKVFLTTVNVFTMEIIKVVVCSSIIIYSNGSIFKYINELKTSIVDNKSETLKVCVPALIYTLQNNLYYIALSHLEATTFCITYQMKIFTTAIFMYMFLGKKLSSKQWIALCLLVLGVADIQIIYSPPPASENIHQNPMLGLISVLTMCFTSAFAGVYLEKVLKTSSASIWMQNIRLALIGLPISFFTMWYYDWEKINEEGAFRGWDIVVVCLTVTNSIGGILISVVIKYADNILKAYAQSMAIVGAAIGSWLLFDFTPGFLFVFGTALVIVSIIVYTAFPYRQEDSPLASYSVAIPTDMSSSSSTTTTVNIPTEIWEKITYELVDHPTSLCLLSKTSTKLRDLIGFVVGHYEAHLHITFPQESCCTTESISSNKVEFEMILNRKAKFRIGKAHCHSHFSCDSKKLDLALQDLMSVFSDELISMRFNNFKKDTNVFTIFNQFDLPKVDNLCFDGALSCTNGVYDLLQSCRNLKRLAISNPAYDTDFSKFWPLLKGSKIDSLDMMDVVNFNHSVKKEFGFPKSITQLFFCPKKDVPCQNVENLALLLLSASLKRVYIHSDLVVDAITKHLYKDLKTVREFCFSSSNFALNTVVDFMKKCPNVGMFNWYGLHSCVAPIVIARFLTDIPRPIIFGGCVACKTGQTVGEGGFMEVGQRVGAVQITRLLQQPAFNESYGNSLCDAVLFEMPFATAAVMVRIYMSLSLVSKLNVGGVAHSFKRCLSTKCYTPLLRQSPNRNISRVRFVREISSANPLPKMSHNGKNIVLNRYDIINKPANDAREYRGLELTNGLRVLLVSDPTTDKSAAALDVNVGHLMDPWELPGLAHFCEHMLFLGTAKYPSENEYSKFLSAHAGSSNAYTASDHTNYHFDVKPEQLPGALDRFVQFFLAPQFTESATEREVCAVDSEHSNNLNNDSWRTMQVDRSLSKPGHDNGKFGTGNKKTLWEDAKLKGIEPREALLKFHQQWYSSNIMTLCVIGKESLDELEEYLGTLEFDAIQNKNLERKEWLESPYGPEELGRRVEVVPIKDNRYLNIAFPFPDMRAGYKSQPEHYISHLLGHEGPGSLLSELKRRGWVSSLSCGYHTSARGYGVFEISVDLSPEGLEHTEEIIELAFNYIGMLERVGPQKWVQDELAELGAMKFRFKDKENPITMATTVAADLQHTPFEDILSYKYLMTEYDPDRIMESLKRLSPDNMQYRVVAKKFAGQEGNTKEPVYGTEIRVVKIPNGTIDRFRKARVTAHPALHMPEKNEYIPTKFDLKPREAIKSEVPRMISENGWCRVWFKQDDEFKMPKTETKLALTTPVVSQDPRKAVLSSLWLWCLSDTLAEETYNADLAGLKCQLDAGPFGVQMKVSGYDEKQALFVKHLVNRMTNFQIDSTRFHVLFESLRRALSNFSHSQPYSLTQHFATLLLSDKAWSKEQLLEVCADVNQRDVEEFSKEMLKAFHVELFVHGNSTEKEALELGSDVTNILKNATKNSRPLYWNEYTPRRECALNNGDELVYRHYQNTHEVSCVEVIYQIGVQNTFDNAVAGLFEFIVREPAFNTLRTNEALGYIVWAGNRITSGTLSFTLLVQGPKSADHVLERVEAFVQKTRNDIQNMPDEEFAQQVAGMIAQLKEKPKTLKARFRRFWQEIENRLYDFDRRNEEIAILEKIKKEDVLALFDKKFGKDAAERKRLAVIVHGKNETPEKVAEIIKSRPADSKQKEIEHSEELRQTLPFYGRPKPKINLKPIGVDPLKKSDNEVKSNL
ncbi:unnamed protein product [Caenorhabditis bovis]|uniref:Insulin-degrading enzyme n=1 Tax=Caenorhabditis bovis TaxID=2654633 RepID=A0A8S1E4V5_9PELO|nr:unnamed protein product [Caenorhabditis bovis]